MKRRYDMRRAEPKIGRDALGAHVEAAMLDVLHDEELSASEKLAALDALRGLACDVSERWQREHSFYGEGSHRLFFRMSGLTRDGLLTPELVARIAEVSGDE